MTEYILVSDGESPRRSRQQAFACVTMGTTVLKHGGATSYELLHDLLGGTGTQHFWILQVIYLRSVWWLLYYPHLQHCDSVLEEE